MSKYPEYLSKLILSLKKLPNVGERTAERLAFHLISNPSSQIEELGLLIQNLPKKISTCSQCNCLIEINSKNCNFCSPNIRDTSIICVLAQPKDVFVLESTKCFKGSYYVIGELLSPIKKNKIFHFNIEKLKNKILTYKPKELILSLDATLEGDTTALYIKKEFSQLPLKISRLALGVPVGLSFEYLDGNTLERAFIGRNIY